MTRYTPDRYIRDMSTDDLYDEVLYCRERAWMYRDVDTAAAWRYTASKDTAVAELRRRYAAGTATA